MKKSGSMKKFLKIVAGAAFVGVLAAGCSSAPEYIETTDSKQYSTMGLDYHDIEKAALQSVDSLLESDEVAALKGRKVLAISDFVNDTMTKIDVEQLSRKVTRELRKAKKFELTGAIAGSGATQDKMINKARSLRENEEFNQKSVAEKDSLKAPEYSLSGKIVQRNAKVSGKQRADYYFLLSLTEIKSGIVIWDDEVMIIKLGDNKGVAW